jgi:serine/threonine-protein kinase HipA
MNEKKLYVYVNNEFKGQLINLQEGGFEFQYSKKNTSSISLSLPYKKEIYQYKDCHGFFNGLLPENEETKQRIAKKYGINQNNDFSLLEVIGYDCSGAVSFSKKRNDKTLKEFYEIKVEKIDEASLEKFINDIPQKPLGLGIKDLRLSLAGAQDKTAVLLIDNQIFFPSKNTPTTHILKPAIKNFKQTVENEYICLKTAQKLGLKVPNVEIRQAGKTKYFLIERYDRKIENNQIKRIHQEDFCQALNIASAYKYETDGGVSYKKAFEVLKKTTIPIVNINRFIDYMIFNYLILNNDAHGKNYSILYFDNGVIELAPLYDVLCTRIYPHTSTKMAMEIGGNYSDMEIYPEHFQKMAKELGINYPQLKKRIISQCKKLPKALKSVIDSFENKIGNEMYNLINKHCQKTLKRFENN